ncbi:MAG TPA: hypothetical protein VFY10_13030 [Dehalococcoidia bacterium]|nr:hypothetical protein [Dehalococcoidia bacterium]
MDRVFNYRMSRRHFLGASAGIGLSMLLLRGRETSCASPLDASAAELPIKHNVWVWRFDVDGHPDVVLEALRANGLGVILKTNDGADWMSRYDKSSTAIVGAQKVREMSDYFESAGVPFHAWAVVHGKDPLGEAQLCSEVLDCGARSMTFDLEPEDEGGNYWQGTDQDALTFGQELRRLQPRARLSVAPDGRPWQIDATPVAQFATFCDEIQPQSYWQTFNSSTNRRYLSRLGYTAGPEGVTPELILDATNAKLRPFGLPIRPIGQGAAGGPEWQRFVEHAYSLQMESVSVWRFGTASPDVWPTLASMAPQQPPPPAPATPAPVAAIPGPADQPVSSEAPSPPARPSPAATTSDDQPAATSSVTGQDVGTKVQVAPLTGAPATPSTVQKPSMATTNSSKAVCKPGH